VIGKRNDGREAVGSKMMQRGRTLPYDISRRLDEMFADAERPMALAALLGAVIHDGSPADTRLKRCALVASGGSLYKLQYYVGLLKVDYRDVIVAGQYEVVEGKLAHVRDLTTSF
jgi:hypothetical protein